MRIHIRCYLRRNDARRHCIIATIDLFPRTILVEFQLYTVREKNLEAVHSELALLFCCNNIFSCEIFGDESLRLCGKSIFCYHSVIICIDHCNSCRKSQNNGYQ